MNVYIPTDFTKVDAKHFEWLLDGVNWRRDAYYDGEKYYAREWTGGSIGVRKGDGSCYINPEYFKAAFS